MSKQRKAILILGMHRSGTSALARMLNILGCDLPVTLMPAAPTNSMGHWESNAIMALNDEILHSGGSQWNDWQEFNPEWYKSPVVDSFVERGTNLIIEEYGSSPLFVFKDPRNCRLLRFWLDVLKKVEIDPLIILPLRNPLEVAASLEVRDGMHPDIGMLLWLRHILDAEKASRGQKRLVTTYDDLLDNWGVVANRMQDTLGLTWPRFSTTTAMDIDAFLGSDKKHHKRSTKNLLSNPMIAQWVRDTDRVMVKWAESCEDEKDHVLLDDIREQLNAAGPMFGRLTHAFSIEHHENMGLRNALQVKDAEIAQLNDQVAAVQQQRAQSEEQAAQQQAEREQYIQDIDAARQKLDDELMSVRAHVQALEALRHQEQQALAGELEKASENVSRQQHELATLDSRLRQREEEICQTLADLDAERKQRSEIESGRQELESQIDRLMLKMKDSDQWVFRLAEERRFAEDRAESAEKRLIEAEKILSSISSRFDQTHAAKVQEKRLRHQIEEQIAELTSENVSLREQYESVIQRWEVAQSELVTLSKMLQEQEVGAAAAGSSFAQSYSNDEAQLLSTLLREKESDFDRSARQVEWLQKVNAVVTGYPWWWALAPRRWRVKWQRGRLLRRGLFDAESYLNRYPDVSSSGVDPLRHYIIHGIRENRTFSAS